MAEDTDETSLLSRWSRRKLEAKSHANEPSEEPEQDQIETIEETSIEEPDPQLEENRLAAEAVDLDKLNYESDFSVFMKDGVPDLLKRQALKALWRSSPVLANVDGLVDYDDDFANPDLIMKTFDSAWKIGKGYFDADQESDEADGSKPHNDEEVVTSTEPSTSVELQEDENDHMAEGINVAEDDEEDTEVEPDTVESVEPEAEMPKVSLRKRLMLET